LKTNVSFYSKLNGAWAKSDSALCVGLDPDINKLPAHLKNDPLGIQKFCIDIVDATADTVCAFKPQIAYFAAVGAEAQLQAVCDHIRTQYPHVVLILDAKRGDIGDTAALYAREAFERYQADAVTVNPYLGTDSLLPFLQTPNKGTIVLCRTSNSGSGEFQSKMVNGTSLYKHVAIAAASKWRDIGETALVMGATYPQELAEVRGIVGDMPFLVPGIGAQGGDIVSAVRAGRNEEGTGLIINSSRAVLYASNGEDFAQASRAVAIDTRDAIRAANN
jgi:orotidine-5'-phosphate decarboxylase